MVQQPLQANDVYQWVGPTMRRTLFGTRQGSLVLTETHLAFVTRGGNDVPARLVLATLGGLLPADWGVALGVADAARGPLARLRPSQQPAALSTGPGSWLAPLAAVVQCTHVVRAFSSYLRVGIRRPDGRDVAFALGRQVVFPEAAEFEQVVARLRDGR